jgi:hypothetical protein
VNPKQDIAATTEVYDVARRKAELTVANLIRGAITHSAQT